MAADLPLIVLDEVMLPGADTEVGLEPEEAAQLAAAWGDEGGGAPVLVACRAPGHPTPTRMEQRASGSPGQLLAGCLLGEGHLLPPEDDDPAPRLSLASPSRQRLEDVRRVDAGWVARCSPWPLAPADVTEAEVDELVRRFLRVLLATRPVDADDAAEAIGRPVADLSAAGSVAERLLLLADYLFEDPGVRSALLSAPDATTIRELIAGALELAEDGLPVSPGALREPLAGWLRATSEGPVTQLARAARVLTALAPLVTTDEATLATTRRLAEDLEDASDRFERLAVKLAKPARGRRPR